MASIKKGDRFNSDGIKEIEKLFKSKYKTVYIKNTLQGHIDIFTKKGFKCTVIVKDLSFIAGSFQAVEVFGIFIGNDILDSYKI